MTPKGHEGIITVPLRMINPSPYPVMINKGVRVAQISRCGENCTIRSVDVATSATTKPIKDIPAQKQQALWNIVEQSDEALPGEQQLKLYNLLLGHAEVFAMGDDDLGRTNHLTHTISTGNHPPI